MSVFRPSVTASFVYDGDGKRVKSIINGETTLFVSAYYEVKGSEVAKYDFAGSTRIATLAPHCVRCSAGVRTGSTLSYLLTDHLGSTSITTNSAGALVSELRYKPWGEVRYSNGTTSTKYTYTGQYSNASEFGLMYYNARWYDPALSRFTQADSIVPGGVQGLDRYAYVNNSPVRYSDPSGHAQADMGGGLGCKTREECGLGLLPNPNSGIIFSAPNGTMTTTEPPIPTINDFILFSKSDTCYVMLHDSRLCSPDAQTAIANGLRSGPYSIQSMSDALFNPNYMAGGLSLSSTFLGYGEEMADVHIPFIGIALDASSQLMQDSNRNYSALQRAARAGVVAVEGQVIALPATGAVGALTVIGLPTTGPIGLPLSATAYISVNTYGSNIANQINQQKIFPAINYYLP